MTRAEPIDTRARLLEAATELFAEHGFHRTTARDVAERAGVNLAAANYHYGSKKALYLEVLRGEFAAVRAELARHHATVPAPERLAKMPRREIEALLGARIRTMLDVIVGPPRRLHGALMQREMADPSEALPVVVDEFIGPMTREVGQLISALAPDLDAVAVERCARSLIAQGVFYAFCRPALLQMMGREEYPQDFSRVLGEHVLRFSLGGIERVSRSRKGRTGAR